MHGLTKGSDGMLRVGNGDDNERALEERRVHGDRRAFPTEEFMLHWCGAKHASLEKAMNGCRDERIRAEQKLDEKVVASRADAVRDIRNFANVVNDKVDALNQKMDTKVDPIDDRVKVWDKRMWLLAGGILMILFGTVFNLLAILSGNGTI